MIQVKSKRIVDEYRDFSFSRPSMAYGPKGKLYHPHNARFLPGKFGQAVLVEEGTTNLLPTNISNVETGKTGFRTRNDSAISRDTTQHWEGNASLKVVTAAQTTSGLVTDSIPASPSTKYTVSIWLKGAVGGESVLLRLYESASIIVNIQCNLTTEWQRFTATATTFSTSTSVRPYVVNSKPEVLTFYADGLQIEKKSYPTTFVNGTRAADNLSISPDVINLAEGEIELTVIPQIISGTHIHFEANAGSNNKNQFMIWKESVWWRVGLMDKDGTIRYININYDGQVGVPTDIKLKWRNINSGSADAEVKAIINGVKKGHITGVQIDMDPLTVAYIGRRTTSESCYGDALYDDLRISSIYRPDEDDIAAYESNQPLPVDQYTTLKLGFDGPDGQRGTAIVTL